MKTAVKYSHAGRPQARIKFPKGRHFSINTIVNKYNGTFTTVTSANHIHKALNEGSIAISKKVQNGRGRPEIFYKVVA